MSRERRKPIGTHAGATSTTKSRVGLAAVSVSAIYALPGTALGALVSVTGSPVTLGLADAPGTIVTWDVDGAGGADFRLRKIGPAFAGIIAFGSGGLNGRGLVGTEPYDVVSPLPDGFNVNAAANWLPGGNDYRRALQKFNSGAGIGDEFDRHRHAAPGDRVIGFRFLSGADLLYGWATIDLDLVAETVTIRDWTYNTTPGGDVQVDSVPEPSALGLLALGAGGLTAWRSRRRKASRAGT